MVHSNLFCVHLCAICPANSKITIGTMITIVIFFPWNASSKSKGRAISTSNRRNIIDSKQFYVITLPWLKMDIQKDLIFLNA